MSKYDENNEIRCSFCGRPQSQVTRLVAGPDVYICDECVELCVDIIRDESAPKNGGKHGERKLPLPKEMGKCL